MDYNFLIFLFPHFVKALYLTLQISFLGIVISLFIGFITALFIHYNTFFFAKLSKIYVELSRNTPLLVQLFFIYFGLGQVGIKIDSFTCAVIGLSFLGGGYMSECFRAGLSSISRHVIESASALGLEKLNLIYYVMLPQALSVAIPGICANAIFLLKETSVVSVIALADVMGVTREMLAMYYKSNETLLALVLSYLVILLPLSLMFSMIEKRIKRYV